MTAAVAAAPATPAAGHVSRRRAMLALARVEAVRFLRHPLTIAALLLFVAPWVYDLATGTTDRYPVLHDKAVGMQIAGIFVLGGGALVVANLNALRAHRHHTDALYSVLVLPGPWRTGAFLLAPLPYAAVVTAIVTARIGALALLPGAAGRPDPAELVTIPALVLLFAAAGVLLAGLVRSAVVAPLAMFTFAVAAFVALVAAARGNTVLRLLLPVMFADLPFALPAEVVARPSLRHLAYLAGLTALVAVAAVARSGARGRRVVTAAVLAALLTAGAGAAQFRTDPALRRAAVTATDNPAALQTCHRRGDVTYCPFDDFTAWVTGWDTVVRGVRRAFPAAAVTGPPLTVRQRVWAHDYPIGSAVTSDAADEAARDEAWARAAAAAGTPAAVPVGTTWGDNDAEATFAAAVALRLMTGSPFVPGGTVCGARGALLVWLVGQATPATAKGLRHLDEASSGALVFADPMTFLGLAVPDRDAAPALAALRRPAAEIAALVAADWSQLTDPATPADRFATLLGVPIASEPPLEERHTCAT
ncbi:hypothetical protein Daura_47050 [Dactylosporangium aurantiacum]|uniref:Uncharacterized protein n=1 Tax=Dactylosporangium aurantiacum TaxID=35754 RepID=A0A9Q9MIS5_9ACTN|nr:hypothetical protein [Dactylosporangium aurantiacum]MDG6105501.1 hypothetical protein [Dactylosporangium aurantiacum]UWZ53966.1 hypothetical protein Daura_47050 [Dactylosporangium aurantiacum]